VQLHATDDVERFATAATPFLEADPCPRNVPHWIIELARRGTGGWSAPPQFWWFTDGDDVVGTASWTPPYSVLVTAVPGHTATLLASVLSAQARLASREVTGVNGPRAAARAVADAWSTATGAAATDERLMYLYELTNVQPVIKPQGEKRPAAIADVDVLAGWLVAFNRDVKYPAPPDPRAAMQGYVAHGAWDVWDVNGVPVAMAGHSIPLAGVVRITTVYTPPEQRGNGYARRLVAEVSADALARDDVQRCMLFTVAADPVPNRIYTQIGYQRTAEHADIRFGPQSDLQIE
jgi:predicted GNAT family acetyltransferase